MRTLKETLIYYNANFKDLKDYVDQKVNDLKSYVDSVKVYIQDTSSKYDTIIDITTEINNKMSDDFIDRVNSLGTPDDFDLGFNDALSGKEYGYSIDNSWYIVEVI